MTPNTEAHRETRLLSRQIETLYRVNRYMSSIYNLDELLNLIQWEAEVALDAEASCIALFNPSDTNIRIEFASGGKGREGRELSQPLGLGFLGHLAATNALMRVDDVRQDQRFDPTVDKKNGFTTRCKLANPIRGRDELLGVQSVINISASATSSEGMRPTPLATPTLMVGRRSEELHRASTACVPAVQAWSTSGNSTMTSSLGTELTL